MAQGYHEGYEPPLYGRIPPATGAAAPPYPRAHAAVQAAPQPARQRHGQPQQAAPLGSRVARMLNVAGALMSVALIAGVGIWSYRLMVRDVTGVPVIRALAGPARVSPEDPGGRQAAYQGLAVNTVAAEGGAGSAAQTIALAPQSAELTEEDRSSAVLALRAQEPIAAPAPAGQTQTAADQAVEAVLSATEPAPVQLVALPASELIPASVPGISRSPLPRRRNATLAAAAPRPDPAAPAAQNAPAPGSDAQAEALLQELVTRLGTPRVTEIDPVSLTPGTRLVQLGVYDDETAARNAWETIATRYPSFLEDRGRIVEAATSGGRVFYRLRAAGFADEPEARRFCTMLMAENIDCIPALIR